MAEDRKRNVYNVTQEQFVELWQKANTADEAVAEFSRLAGQPVKKTVVLGRAAVYRANEPPINLKKMPRKNPRKLDASKLNAKIAELGLSESAAS